MLMPHSTNTDQSAVFECIGEMTDAMRVASVIGQRTHTQKTAIRILVVVCLISQGSEEKEVEEKVKSESACSMADDRSRSTGTSAPLITIDWLPNPPSFPHFF